MLLKGPAAGEVVGRGSRSLGGAGFSEEVDAEGLDGEDGSDAREEEAEEVDCEAEEVGEG